MSVFLLPVSVCDEIQEMMNSFWWGASSGNGKGIRWQSWTRLARAKEMGGMGFCDLQVFNFALLGKQGWNFIHNPNTLVARLFKAKYFPHGSYLSSSLGSNPSFVWRSVWSTKEVVNRGTRWRVGDGKSIYAWKDVWVRDLPGFRVRTNPTSGLENLKVLDLLLDAGRGRDSDLVHSIFENNVSLAICSIPLAKSQTSDSLMWHYSNNGFYTVKSCYRMLTGSLHETESRLYVSSWKKLWKLFLPPKIISFLWRLCNSCILVSVRQLDKGMNLPTCCVLCGQGPEHYWHIFYDCPYSSSCWTAAKVVKPTLTTDEFPVWLLKLIDDLDPDVMCSVAMILWCVWRQRNQKLWETL